MVEKGFESSSADIEERLLLAIDWDQQAQACLDAFENTGDTDYLKMRLDALKKAKRKRKFLASLALHAR